jgi:hypothetical protein
LAVGVTSYSTYAVTNHIPPIIYKLICMEKSGKSEESSIYKIGGTWGGVVDDIDMSDKYFLFYFYSDKSRISRRAHGRDVAHETYSKNLHLE